MRAQSPSVKAAEMVKLAAILVLSAAVVSAYPANDPVISTWSPGLRYDYLEDGEGSLHLVDNWLKLSDYQNLARYDPDTSNRYHLFTRANPSISQVLVPNNPNTVISSNFDPNRITVFLQHGFGGSITTSFNTVLVPAYLAAGDVNVIVLDWSAGSYWGPRAREAAQAAGRFINWLIATTLGNSNLYHITGFSVGGHGAGIMARTVNGNVGYVTALDPADRWDADWYFSSTDGLFTEVVHTNADDVGVTQALGHVDYYPNGGRSMPGCITSICHHNRSFHYKAESLRLNGFTATRCATLNDALSGSCNLEETLRFSGLYPPMGRTGMFWFRTNPIAPFSQG